MILERRQYPHRLLALIKIKRIYIIQLIKEELSKLMSAEKLSSPYELSIEYNINL